MVFHLFSSGLEKIWKELEPYQRKQVDDKFVNQIDRLHDLLPKILAVVEHPQIDRFMTYLDRNLVEDLERLPAICRDLNVLGAEIWNQDYSKKDRFLERLKDLISSIKYIKNHDDYKLLQEEIEHLEDLKEELLELEALR